MSVFSSIPFSRSIVRTASMISRLIVLPFVDQVAPDDRFVRDLDAVAVRGQPKPPLLGGEDLSPEARPAADLLRGAERDLPADDVSEVRRLAQRPSEPRRGDIDRVAVEIAAEEPGHTLAERMVDPLRVVDEDGEAVPAGELDCEHLHAWKISLDRLPDLSRQRLLLLMHLGHSSLSKKTGAMRPFRQAGEMWCKAE